MITFKYFLPAILIFFSACSPSTPPLPTATLQLQPTFTQEPAPTEAPIVVVGYDGPMNEVQQQCLEESERGSEMIAAFNNYIMIWQKFKVFGPGASLSYVPVLDRAFPDDPEKCVIMIEIYGDQTYAGKLVGMPFGQVRRYLETSDPDQLTPPQNATKLETNTDPAVLSKTVTEGSVYAAAGIPLGARLEYWNGEFVYVTGSVEDLKIVGKLNDKYQPEAVDAVPAEAQALVDQGMVWDETKQAVYDNKTGLVWGLQGQDGEWYSYPEGIVPIPAGDGSGAPPLEVPIYASIQDALWGITDELPWNDRSAYKYRDYVVKENKLRADRYWRPAREVAVEAGVSLPMEGRQYEVTFQTNESGDKSVVLIGEFGFEDGTVVTSITYASRATGYSFVSTMVVGDPEEIYQALLAQSEKIYIPGPEEVRDQE